MSLTFAISPQGRLLTEESAEAILPALGESVEKRIRAAGARSSADLLLHLATTELETPLPPALDFPRQLARNYLHQLCQTPGLNAGEPLAPLSPPAKETLAMEALQAPPMKGLEYLSADVLADWWRELDVLIRAEIDAFAGGAQAYLRDRHPLWRLVGRVSFHLAENKRDPDHPFAFLATYAHKLSSAAKLQHLPLSRALQEYAGTQHRQTLLNLLTPIQRAAEQSEWVKTLVESGAIYRPLAWKAPEAYRFLQSLPTLEQSGIIVRVPDWWKAKAPPRARVSVQVGDRAGSKLGVDALLDFSVHVSVGDERLSESELREILQSSGGLVALRGKWVEVDREKLSQALEHWKRVEKQAGQEGISFFEGMRLLAGASLASDASAELPEEIRHWTGVQLGDALRATLDELRDPTGLRDIRPTGLAAQLRPYQQLGVNWLTFMLRLGLGACLADDMGLGKTIQVISLLLHLKESSSPTADSAPAPPPSLLVVPASLIANWKSEISRFAPALKIFVAHPSETDIDALSDSSLWGADLVITTYGMATRLAWVRDRSWRLVILDEAQAIKNSGTRQTRAVKAIKATGRVALTGTPVENRLSDLWSLFDFLNPGLLGDAKAFGRFVKDGSDTEQNRYAPLRALVKPYILRRLKTDKSIIADLPDKTETNAFCSLSKPQAALYQQSVEELAKRVNETDGIQRRGIVLSYLLRLKQICNHPSQWLGDGMYDPSHSGKFSRLAELCGELAERQEKVLIFTQFREITSALSGYLQTLFGKPGLVLHGGTEVGKRREMVNAFQREEGPPFFVLSLKAGGTGLNLTAASHVIHFDRWWNPAVENQATDRAFRIGQKKNVFVHKFVCRGTVEDRIDAMIRDKLGLSKDLLEGGGEALLTEMNNEDLLRFVSLDIHRAVET